MAGPLFTSGECFFNKALAEHLKVRHHQVWLPQEEQADGSPNGIFFKDLEGLRWADVVVANMDGPDPDSGTSWECGWAYASQKPVILFKTDFRSLNEGSPPLNLMLLGGAARFLHLPKMHVSEVAEHIHREMFLLNV